MEELVVYEHLIANMGFTNVSDVRHICYKTLTESDVSKHQSRLAISRNQVVTPFLIPKEDFWLQMKTDEGRKKNISVNVVAGSTKYQLTLARWNHPQNNNNNRIYGWNYVLTGGWNELREDNNLQSGDRIRVVSFRFHDDKLGFVLLPASAN